jgi:hypothetical protein
MKTGEKLKKTTGKRIPPPPGPGRPKGVPNKVNRELASAAQEYTEEALEILIKVARSGRSEAARVAAACAILDRGHGRPRQMIDANVKGQLTLEQLVLGSYKTEAEQALVEHQFHPITGVAH